MTQSSIVIDVKLDDERVPQDIQWKATDSTVEVPQAAKAFILSFWDGAEKTALRIDLWTQRMMVDEMADFYYQTLITMADTFGRATHMEELKEDMKGFARAFYEKFQQEQEKTQKLQ